MALMVILFLGLLAAFSVAIVLASIQQRHEQKRLAKEYQEWVNSLHHRRPPRRRAVPPPPPKRRTVEDALREQRVKRSQPKSAKIIKFKKK